jgi:hypothetical protein
LHLLLLLLLLRERLLLLLLPSLQLHLLLVLLHLRLLKLRVVLLRVWLHFPLLLLCRVIAALLPVVLPPPVYHCSQGLRPPPHLHRCRHLLLLLLPLRRPLPTVGCVAGGSTRSRSRHGRRRCCHHPPGCCAQIQSCCFC